MEFQINFWFYFIHKRLEISSNFFDMILWVFSVSSSTSLTHIPFVDISSIMEILISPLLKIFFSWSRKVLKLLKTTGIIGTCASIAAWNAPFLNSWIFPVQWRVPSGKIISLMLFLFKSFTALLTAWIASFFLFLSIKIVPDSQKARPNGPVKYKFADLDRKVIRPKWDKISSGFCSADEKNEKLLKNRTQYSLNFWNCILTAHSYWRLCF